VMRNRGSQGNPAATSKSISLFEMNIEGDMKGTNSQLPFILMVQ